MQESLRTHNVSYIAKAALTVLLLGYPLVVYFGLSYFDIRVVSSVLLGMFLVRFLLERNGVGSGGDRKRSFAVVAIGSLICLMAIYANDLKYLKLYPVCVNLIFLSVFSYSLLYPPTMVERFARIKHKKLSNAAVCYLRNVTLVWCGFFIVNGFVAMVTAFWMSTEIWTLYNGLISYILMGVIFAGEYIFRYVTKMEARMTNG